MEEQKDPPNAKPPLDTNEPIVTTEQTTTVATKITTTGGDGALPGQAPNVVAPQGVGASKGETATPDGRHALQIALDNPGAFLKVVVGATASILGLLLLATFLIAEFLICNNIIIPGVYSVSAKTNQVIVPASAGWVAVNPDVPFKKGTKLRFKVSGRVHLGIHEVVDLAKFRGPLTVVPPPMDAANPDCAQATTNLRALGTWRSPWREVGYKTKKDLDPCRLSPTQVGGKLVYAVLENPPTAAQLGVNILDSAGVKANGVLEADTQITLAEDGFVILTVNDRMDCDGTYVEKRDKLQAYLSSVSSCAVSPGKDPSSLFDLGDDLMKSATIADNQGEFFVHLTVD